MSDHRHEWPVDAACDCGLMISENSQAQAAQITALEAEMKRLRTMCSELEAEVGRWKDYELSKDIAEIKSGYADFAPFVALARTTQKFYDWVLATVDAGYLAPVECVDEVHAALAHPTIQRAVKEGHDGATID